MSFDSEDLIKQIKQLKQLEEKFDKRYDSLREKLEAWLRNARQGLDLQEKPAYLDAAHVHGMVRVIMTLSDALLNLDDITAVRLLRNFSDTEKSDETLLRLMYTKLDEEKGSI